MVRLNKKLVLKCEGVQGTKRYRKYRLPVELFKGEDSVVLFSGRHVYLRKGGGAEVVEQVVIMLGSGGNGCGV